MVRQSFIFICLLMGVVIYAPGHSLQYADQASSFSRVTADVLAPAMLTIPLSALPSLGWSPTLGWPSTSTVPLKTLAQRLSLPLVQVKSHLYWLSPPRHLRGILPEPNAIRFELSGFVPVDIQQNDKSLELIFQNTLTLLPEQRWPWQNAWLSGVQMFNDPKQRQVRVQLTLSAPVVYRLTRHWSNGASTIELRMTETLAKLEPPEETFEPFQYQALDADTSAGKTTIHEVSVPNVNTRYHWISLLPQDGLGTLSPLSHLLKQSRATLAINANFFDPVGRMPIGLLLQNGRLERVDYARRGALGVDLLGGLYFWYPDAQARVEINGQTLDLNGLNRPPRSNELVLISNAYGLPVVLPEIATVIRVRHQIVQSIVQTATVEPDRQSDYLIATGLGRAQLAEVQPGMSITTEHTLSPTVPVPMKYAWGAGPMLLQGGQVVLDARVESFSPAFAVARAARSVIGLTADGTLLLIIVLQDQDNAGMTLAELARWMQTQGAVSALALDGGGSASLSFLQEGQWHHLGGARPVAVGLGLVPR